MSAKKLYAFDTKATLGASDIVYVASADGSADGKASFTELRPVLAGVLSGTFATYSAALDIYGTISPSANVQAILACADYAAIKTLLALTIGTNVQAYSANLTTFAAIAPSANVQTLLGAADFAAFRTSLSIGSIGLLSTITEANQTLADNTTGNVSSTKHGYAPKSGADATTFLNGASTPAYAQVKDSDLATTDITTNNATTAKHGFLKKLSNVSTEYMDGTGAWSVPAGSGGSALTVKDEGTNKDTAVTSIDFVGAGVTATNVSHAITVTIPGPWDFSPPTAASFSLSSSDATSLALTDDTDVGLLVDLNGLSAGAIRHAYRTLATPASAWDLKVKCKFFAPNVNLTTFGLVAYNSSSNRNNQLVRLYDGTNSLGLFRYSAANTFSSTLSSFNQPVAIDPISWLRMAFDGTNIVYYVSVDGKKWVTVLTEAVATYLTATGGTVNRVGLMFGVARTTGLLPAASVPYFSLTGPGV